MTTTKARPRPSAPAPVDAELVWSEDFGMVPLWLQRGTTGLTHGQFRILVVLITKLGRRKAWVHLNYAQIAEWACTDINTVTRAVGEFTRTGWLTVKGPRNWRLYKLDKAAVANSVYKVYDDGEDE